MSCARCFEVCGQNDVVIHEPVALDPVWMHEARRENDAPPTFITMPGEAPPRHSITSQDSLDEFPADNAVQFETAPSNPKVHRHRMDELEVLDKAYWCCYVLCGGCGATEQPASMHYISKCCCCRETCEYVDASVENSEGTCSCVHTCCTCVTLFQFPFREATPVCVLCTAPFCGWHGKSSAGHDKNPKSGGRRSESDEVPASLFDHVMNDMCVLCYCCGGGVACAGTVLDIYESFTKCCCCRCTLGCSPPWAEDGCCAHLIDCGRYHSQCRCPIKKESNPLCACCGKRFKKIHPHGRNIGVGAPKQQEMR